MADPQRGPYLAGGFPGQHLVRDQSNRTLWVDGREALLANRDYYVSPTGKDSNDGLSAASAFRQPQRAANVIAGLDLGGLYSVTVHVADGTYGGLACRADPVGAQPGSVLFIGNITTPVNVQLQDFNYFSNAISVSGCKAYNFAGFGLWSGYYGTGFGASGKSVCQIWDMYFNPDDTLASFNIYADDSYLSVWRPGSFTEHGDMQFDGAAPISAVAAVNHAIVRYFVSRTASVNNPAWYSGFAYCYAARIEFGTSLVFSGASTGKKYHAEQNGIINTGGSGPDYLPGSLPGDVATGGQYL